VPHVELALVGLRVGDELLEVVGREVLADREQFRLFGDQPDWLKILLRVIAQVGIEHRRRGVRANVTGNDRIAVGSRTRRAQRSNRAAGTADILDHELLPEMAGKDVCNDAAGHVGWSARRERYDHRYRSRRVILSLRATHSGEHQRHRRNPPRLHCPLP
jgi:hypothetical protein